MSINSQAEQQAVGEKITGGQGTLIGLYRDPKDKSRWLWVDGSRPTFTYWYSGEPNNVGGNEDCVHLRPRSSGFRWNDLACHQYSLPHVCETSGKKSENIILFIIRNSTMIKTSCKNSYQVRYLEFQTSHFKRAVL